LFKSILIWVWRGFGWNRTGGLQITQISQVPRSSPLSCSDGYITEDSSGHSRIERTHLTDAGIRSRRLGLWALFPQKKWALFPHRHKFIALSAWYNNLRVSWLLFFFCLCFFDTRGLQIPVPVYTLVVITTAIPLLILPLYCFLSEILSHSDTWAVPVVCHAVGLLFLLKLCPTFTFFLQCLAGDKGIDSYIHVHFVSEGLHRRRRVSPRWLMYLLIVGLYYCVMCFAYVLHVCRQNLVPLSCLYTKPFVLVK